MQLPDELADIQLAIPSVVLDIRYATKNNFTGQQLYGRPFALLRHEPLAKLVEANKKIETDGYRLVIFDAFRPVEVQEKLRSFVNDNNYVAEISNHCKGITVDVTLADINGAYLDTGTEYDDFTEKAHPGTDLITKEQTDNRQLLKGFLEPFGFVQHQFEWWHFDYCPDQEWGLIPDQSNIFGNL